MPSSGVTPICYFTNWSVLVHLQVQELYPTTVRSTALGFCSASARVASLAAAPLPIAVRTTPHCPNAL